MRRFFIICGCLVGLGWLVWLVWRMAAAGERASQMGVDAVIRPEPASEPGSEAGGEVEVEPATSPDIRVVDDLASAEPDQSEQVSAAAPGEAPVDLEEVAPESYRRSELSVVVDGDREELLGELAQIRRDLHKRVERHPLYVMAEERGVPHFRRFFMTNGMLLDAILDAEGVPPADVLPSPEAVERVRALAAEMFQRNEAYVAEVTPERHAAS